MPGGAVRAGAGRPGVRADRAAPYWDGPVPGVVVPLIAGVALLVGFVAYESRARDPMLPLGLFRRRTSRAGNVGDARDVCGAGACSFSSWCCSCSRGWADAAAERAGDAAGDGRCSRARAGSALADRYGPRLFMGLGRAGGRGRAGAVPAGRVRVDYVSDVPPVLPAFSVGLSMTVAPLTAAVLAASARRRGSPRR